MTPSIRESILRMVAEHFPALVFGRPRTYVVTSIDSDNRFDLSPPADAQHLPELKAVEQWGQAVRLPELGSEVTVMFRDANPSRPFVVGFALERDPAQLGVARLGDTVDVTLKPAVVNGKLGVLDMIGMIVWSPAQATGNITTASSYAEVP